MYSKKAQGSIEYILIIAAAILVVAVVIIAVSGALGGGQEQIGTNQDTTNTGFNSLTDMFNAAKGNNNQEQPLTLLLLEYIPAGSTVEQSLTNPNEPFGTNLSIKAGEDITNLEIYYGPANQPTGSPNFENNQITAGYFEITPDPTNASKIQSATIYFEIEKNWFQTNNTDPQTITVQHYTNQQWEELPTTYLSENETKYLYTTTTLGFSTFAINATQNPDSPYNITNCEQLQLMNQDLNGNYQLMNDIDCSDTINWTGNINESGFSPIGPCPTIEDCTTNTNNGFQGTLNGNYYTINNLYIYKEPRRFPNHHRGTALFAKNKGTIQNIKLTNLNIQGDYDTAGAVGVNFGTIKNISTTGNITGTYFVGGIVGNNNAPGTISQSVNHATITGTQRNGGITGNNLNGTITNAYNTGTINGFAWCGGITGNNETGNINKTYNNGIINCSGTRVGGIIGESPLPNSTLTDSFSINKIVGSSFDTDVGGIIGSATDNEAITNSYWDINLTTKSKCTSQNNPTCHSTNNQPQLYYDTNGIPFTKLNWNNTIWTAHTNNYPTLKWETTNLFEIMFTEPTFEDNKIIYLNDPFELTNVHSTSNLGSCTLYVTQKQPKYSFDADLSSIANDEYYLQEVLKANGEYYETGTFGQYPTYKNDGGHWLWRASEATQEMKDYWQNGGFSRDYPEDAQWVISGPDSLVGGPGYFMEDAMIFVSDDGGVDTPRSDVYNSYIYSGEGDLLQITPQPPNNFSTPMQIIGTQNATASIPQKEGKYAYYATCTNTGGVQNNTETRTINIMPTNTNEFIFYKEAPTTAKAGEWFTIQLTLENPNWNTISVNIYESQNESLIYEDYETTTFLEDYYVPPTINLSETLLPKTTTIKDFLVKAIVPGELVIQKTKVYVGGNTYESEELTVNITCNNNSVCEKEFGENHLNCNNDCKSWSKDGYCDVTLNNMYDEDCYEFVNPLWHPNFCFDEIKNYGELGVDCGIACETTCPNTNYN